MRDVDCGFCVEKAVWVSDPCHDETLVLPLVKKQELCCHERRAVRESRRGETSEAHASQAEGQLSHRLPQNVSAEFAPKLASALPQADDESQHCFAETLHFGSHSQVGCESKLWISLLAPYREAWLQNTHTHTQESCGTGIYVTTHHKANFVAAWDIAPPSSKLCIDANTSSYNNNHYNQGGGLSAVWKHKKMSLFGTMSWPEVVIVSLSQQWSNKLLLCT